MDEPEVIAWDQVTAALHILGFRDLKGFMRLEVLGRTEVKFIRVVYDGDGRPLMDGAFPATEYWSARIKSGPAHSAVRASAGSVRRLSRMPYVLAALVVVSLVGGLICAALTGWP